MEISKRYNSVPVKDTCALFAPTPFIFGSGVSDDVVKISPLPTPVAMATNFGTKLTTTRPLWKIYCSLFAPIPYFRARTIRWSHLNFSPADPRCYGNEFWNKINYNSAPTKDNCTLFSPTPYSRARAMQWCHVNLSPEDPCCHGNQPFFSFKDKIGCSLIRASNAETQLLGYIAWQWDRYIVPQNVFLVQ